MKDYKIILSEESCPVETEKQIDLKNQYDIKKKISEVLCEISSTKEGQRFLKQLEKWPKSLGHIRGQVFNKEGDDCIGSLRIPYDIEDRCTIRNNDRWFHPTPVADYTDLH